jgi:hypothetical protein
MARDHGPPAVRKIGLHIRNSAFTVFDFLRTAVGTAAQSKSPLAVGEAAEERKHGGVEAGRIAGDRVWFSHRRGKPRPLN